MNGVSKIFFSFTAVNAIRAIAPFLLLPILTRHLSPADYGILSLYEATILVLTPLVLFSSSGLISARFYKCDHDYIAQINTSVVVLAVSCCLVLLAIISVAHVIEGSRSEFGGAFVFFLPAFVLFRAVNAYIASMWQIQHKVRLFGFFSVGTLFTDLGLSFVFVVGCTWGYQGRLIGSNLAFVIFALAGLHLLAKNRLLAQRTHIERYKEIFRFGLPLIPHVLGGVGLAVSSRYLLAYQLGQESVGIFSLAYQVGSIMLLVGTSLNQAWSVLLMKWLGDGVATKRENIRKIMLAMTALLILAAVMLLILKDIVFSLLATNDFLEAKALYPFLVISFLFQSLYFLIVNFDFYEERVIAIGCTTLAVAAFSVLLCYVLVSRFGIMGAAYASFASMLSYFSIVAVRVILFNKNFRQVWFGHD